MYQNVYTEILDNLCHSDVILTANARLCNYLKQQFAQRQTTTVIEQPHIFSLTGWLDELRMTHSLSRRIVLSEFTETQLWYQIIQDYAQSHPIIQIFNTAKLAKQAWQLLNDWQIDPSELAALANEEIETYLNWAQQFEQQLDNNDWTSSCRLAQEIIEVLETGHYTPPQKITLVGFDDISPLYKKLFSAFATAGCEIINFQQPNHNKSVHRIALIDAQTEITQMALWANQLAQQNPHQLIGCIVPNLNQIRDKVEQAFTKICTQPFNLSAGKALSDYPIISAALDFLSFDFDDFTFVDLSKNLMSHYHNSNTADRCCAAKTESELRNYNSEKLTAAAIQHELKRQANNFDSTTIAERWLAYTTQSQTLHQQMHAPSAWIVPMQKLLLAIGWPSERPLNSETYQVTQRWQNLWQEFATLDILHDKINYSYAVLLLKNLAQQTIFQKKSVPSKIHIMGLLESGGIQFDHTWVMGLTDRAWPPTAKPNPFIPLSLQRTLAMPHASSERELHYSEQTQQRLIFSSQNIIVSHAQQEADQPLNASHLISDLPEVTLEDLQLPKYIAPIQNCIDQKILMETLLDQQGPALKSDEITAGGSGILQQQAQCPFRAFAKVRLHAEAPGIKALGIDAAQRGTLTHFVLEKVWHSLKTHENLINQSELTLTNLIDEKINEAIRTTEGLESEFIVVEKQRLMQLILNWLSFEKARPPFKVMEYETNRFIQIGPLKLRIKIDRIDELEDGSQLIIDYKTGKGNSINPWFQEDLSQPQLPIYALFGTQQAGGITFAQVNASEFKFVGIRQNEELCFSNIKACATADSLQRDWLTLQENWRTLLTKFSVDFSQGFAAVQPTTQACLYCDLHSFCRIGMQSYE